MLQIQYHMMNTRYEKIEVIQTAVIWHKVDILESAKALAVTDGMTHALEELDWVCGMKKGQMD